MYLINDDAQNTNGLNKELLIVSKKSSLNFIFLTLHQNIYHAIR